MKNIMVVFSSTNVPEELVDSAINLADDKGGRLIILDVRDRDLSKKVGDLTENMGFMGEKVVGALKKEISHGRCDLIYQKLSIIEDKAQRRGIPYEIVVERGPYAESIIKMAQKKGVSTIICQRRDKVLGKKDFEVIIV